MVFPARIGTIYQATNAVYRGRAAPRTLRLLTRRHELAIHERAERVDLRPLPKKSAPADARKLLFGSFRKATCHWRRRVFYKQKS